MSDKAIRSLERAASTDVEVAAGALIARFRRGELDEARLRLASHLDDPAAVRAALELLEVAPRKKALGTWIRRIGRPDHERWPRELPWTRLVRPVCARVGVAAAELALRVWSSKAWSEGVSATDADTGALKAVLEAARRWLHEPTPQGANSVWKAVGSYRLTGIPTEAAFELASVIGQPVAPGATSPHSLERSTASSAASVADLAHQALAWDLDSPKRAEEQLRSAIRQEATRWLLQH